MGNGLALLRTRTCLCSVDSYPSISDSALCLSLLPIISAQVRALAARSRTAQTILAQPRLILLVQCPKPGQPIRSRATHLQLPEVLEWLAVQFGNMRHSLLIANFFVYATILAPVCTTLAAACSVFL